MSDRRVTLWSVPGIPLIHAGDDLADMIIEAIHRAGERLITNDVLVISSKIVSKSEGRMVDLRTVTASDEAQALASKTGKDPRIVELVLRESASVSRVAPNVLVTTHRLGFTSANAGIDQSNIEDGDTHALLLPVDPDGSAAALRDRIEALTGAVCGVIISDSHGRPFRVGNIGVAIGAAGVTTVLDLRGSEDLYGRPLRITVSAYGDLLASAAHLICGEGADGLPVVLVRGIPPVGPYGSAADLNRQPQHDLYR